MDLGPNLPNLVGSAVPFDRFGPLHEPINKGCLVEGFGCFRPGKERLGSKAILHSDGEIPILHPLDDSRSDLA